MSRMARNGLLLGGAGAACLLLYLALADQEPVPRSRLDPKATPAPSVGEARLEGLDRLESSERPASEGAVRVTVRDLRSGAPVSGIELRVRSEGMEAVQTTDKDGIVLLESGPNRIAIDVMTPGWKSARFEKRSLVRSRKEVWIYRNVTLRVRVEYSETPSDSGDPWIAARVVGPDVRTQEDRAGKTPWNRSWALSHGIEDRLDAFDFDREGSTFLGVIPHVRTSVIAIGREGFRTRVLDVPVAVEQDSIELVAYLERAPVVSGHLLDDQGKPIDDVELHAHIVIEGMRHTLNPGRYAMAGWPVGTRVTRHGEVFVNLQTTVPVDRDGSFRFALPASGRVVLLATAAGRQPLWHDAGSDDRSMPELDLRFGPKTLASPVAIRLQGAILDSATLHISDITDRALQTSQSVSLTADGMCPGHLLVRGRRYWLVASYRTKEGDRASVDGLIEWDERPVVSLDDLESDLDTFLSR